MSQIKYKIVVALPMALNAINSGFKLSRLEYDLGGVSNGSTYTTILLSKPWKAAAVEK